MLPFLKVLHVYFISKFLYPNTSFPFCLTGLRQRAIKEPLYSRERAIPLPCSVPSGRAAFHINCLPVIASDTLFQDKEKEKKLKRGERGKENS